MFSRTLTAFAVSRWLTFTAMLFLLPASGLRGQDLQEPFHHGELLTGQRMRYAFREVVRRAAPCTVSILADGRRIALGTIVGSDGWILTKASQINKATRVQLADGRQFAIRKNRSHHGLDLALLKIDAAELSAVAWQKAALVPGAWMVTVGISPDDVIAVGVLSVARRPIPRSSAHGYLGVELAREELPRIKRVFPNSGAYDAGLKEGDVVLTLNEQPVGTAEELVRMLRDYRPGDTLSLRVKRLEEEKACSVTLMHPYGDFLSRMAFQNQMGGDLSFRRDDFAAVYQHDSVIDPQDCGGPVVNLDGDVIGINIARAGRTETYALPPDLIETAIQELRASHLQPDASEQIASPGKEKTFP